MVAHAFLPQHLRGTGWRSTSSLPSEFQDRQSYIDRQYLKKKKDSREGLFNLSV